MATSKIPNIINDSHIVGQRHDSLNVDVKVLSKLKGDGSGDVTFNLGTHAVGIAIAERNGTKHSACIFDYNSCTNLSEHNYFSVTDHVLTYNSTAWNTIIVLGNDVSM